jgi:hypothetical protein
MDLTIEQFKDALPIQIRKNVTQELVDNINAKVANTEALETFKENLIGYTSVLSSGKYKIASYINAVKYVSFKLLGDPNVKAYAKTFPEKIARFKKEQVSPKDIASYAAAYNKTKLVNLIYEQTLIPSHVLNAPLFQQALNVQAELMMSAKSEKVRSDAANSLLVHLKRPETQKIELDIGIDQGSIIDDYQIVMRRMVEQQKALIAQGGDLLAITNASIKPEVIDVE